MITMIHVNREAIILVYIGIPVVKIFRFMFEMNKCATILILFILVGAFQTAFALERTRLGLVEEGEFSLITGLDYKEGDYGSPDSTSLWRIPVSVTYRKEDFSIFASVPLLFATSDGGIVVSNKGPMSRMKLPGSGQQTESGIGDMVLSGSYYLTPDYRDEITYRLTAIVKLGTAAETKGLGSGENDYSVEGGIIKNIDEYTLSGTLGYEISGDPSGFTYDDVFYGEVGLTRQLAKKEKIGASLYYSQANTDNAEAPLEISFFYRQPLQENREFYFFFSRGLSDSSPDFSVGGSVQFYY